MDFGAARAVLCNPNEQCKPLTTLPQSNLDQSTYNQCNVPLQQVQSVDAPGYKPPNFKPIPPIPPIAFCDIPRWNLSQHRVVQKQLPSNTLIKSELITHERLPIQSQSTSTPQIHSTNSNDTNNPNDLNNSIQSNKSRKRHRDVDDSTNHCHSSERKKMRKSIEKLTSSKITKHKDVDDDVDGDADYEPNEEQTVDEDDDDNKDDKDKVDNDDEVEHDKNDKDDIDDSESSFFKPVKSTTGTTPAASRTGDTDKTWIYCTHPQGTDDDEDCGVHYVRTLRHSHFGAQHHCLSDKNHKLITRTMGKLFKDCTYCTDSDRHCVRAATLLEIKEYQRRCKEMGIVPNGKRGGFKKIGARTTFNESKGIRSKTKEKKKKKKKKKRDRKGESQHPSAVKSEENGISTMSGTEKRKRKRSRKKIKDIESGSVRKKKRVETVSLDKSNLNRYKLETLMLKARQCYPDLELNHQDKWCRYCGSRASIKWGDSPWGKSKLCEKHWEQWMKGVLFLEAFEDEEPMTVSDVINAKDCQERTVLIDLISKYYECSETESN